MADCCAELRAELAALRAEIAKIKPVDEAAIIQKTQASILPQLPGIINPIIFTNINPFKARLGKVENLSGQALKQAKQSLERAYQASDAATRATASANNAAAKSASAIASVAGLVGALAAVGISVATLKVLGSRLDAQEKRADAHDSALSKILELLNPIKSKAERADKNVSTALQSAKDAQSTAKEAIYKANDASYKSADAVSTATKAYEKGNEALYETRIGLTKVEAETASAKKQANDALYAANQANAKASEALKKAPIPGRRGPQGVPGIRGPEGVPGRDGKDGPRGFIGPQGLPGLVGERGPIGERGPAGSPGKNGERGPAGPQGPPGRNGERGLQGVPGPMGTPGKNGERGLQGVPGPMGPMGTPGKNGERGPQGIPGINGKDGKDGMDAETKKAIEDINNKLGFIPLLVAKREPLSFEETVQAANTGVCRSTQPGGCMNGALNNINKNINNNTNSGVGKILDAMNTGANAAQLGLLKQIDNKLGPQIPNGGISNFMQNFFARFVGFSRWLHLDRILNVLTWVNTTHNAYMLSSSLGNTLFSIVDNIGDIFFKNQDGNDIDTRSIIGTSIDNFAKSAFGVSEWNGIKTTWKKWNRIYQAGANIINSVRSITDSIRNVGEWTAENTGRIGNALKKFGVVGGDAFKWMPENVNAQSIWIKRLERLEDAASGIEMITGEVLSTTENLNEIQKQTEEFKKGLKGSTPKDTEDNEKVAAREGEAVTSSTSPTISPERERKPI